MRLKHAWRWAMGFALAGLLAPPTLAGSMCMGGTGGATEPLRLLGARFTALNGGEPVDVVPGLGSGGAIGAAMEGVIQVAVSGRDLTPAEEARGLRVASTLCTPYVLATSYAGPVSLDRARVADLYERSAPQWPDGQAVKIVLRPRNESDNAVLFRLFPGTEDAVQKARGRASVPVAASDQDNADMGEQIPASLIATTYAQMLTEHRSLRLVPIDGVAPGLAAYESGRYPFGKRLRLVTARTAGSDVARFLDFLRTPEGLATLREAGLIPCPPED